MPAALSEYSLDGFWGDLADSAADVWRKAEEVVSEFIEDAGRAIESVTEPVARAANAILASSVTKELLAWGIAVALEVNFCVGAVASGGLLVSRLCSPTGVSNVHDILEPILRIILKTLTGQAVDWGRAVQDLLIAIVDFFFPGAGGIVTSPGQAGSSLGQAVQSGSPADIARAVWHLLQALWPIIKSLLVARGRDNEAAALKQANEAAATAAINEAKNKVSPNLLAAKSALAKVVKFQDSVPKATFTLLKEYRAAKELSIPALAPTPKGRIILAKKLESDSRKKQQGATILAAAGTGFLVGGPAGALVGVASYALVAK